MPPKANDGSGVGVRVSDADADSVVGDRVDDADSEGEPVPVTQQHHNNGKISDQTG